MGGEMITFYPRDIGMWRKYFDFSERPVILAGDGKIRNKTFRDRKELIEFLKDFGVRLNDPNYPLKFELCHSPERLGHYSVIQWTCIGWIKDDFK
jgi:hypothetical protein